MFQPLQAAKEAYAAKGRDFTQELAYHLQHGCVFSAPGRFVMGHAINTAEPDKWPAQKPDAWYVAFAAGPGCLEWFCQQAPYPLPKVAWHRNKGDTDALRIYSWDRLTRKL